MGAEATNGAAAPAAEQAEKSAGGEFSPEVMKGVFAKFGRKLPEAKPEAAAKSEENAGGEGAAGGDENKQQAGANGGEGAGEPSKGATEAAAVETENAGGEGEAGTGAEKPEGQQADEHAAETERVVKAKLKDLPEPQRKIAQSIIDERIGAITAKSKVETERLGARVVELTSELEATRNDKGPVVVQGLHPAILVTTPAEIDRIEDELARQEEMLEQFRETGIEADEAHNVPAFSAAQVRNRIRELQRERERVLPQARTLVQKRAEHEAAVKASFPALYDPRTDEYRMADALRKQLPELRRLPDAAVFVAKLVLGAKALEALKKTTTEGKDQRGTAAAATAAAGAGKKGTTTTPPVKRKAPRAPGDGAAALGSVLDDPRSQQPDATPAMKNFAVTRSREALKGAVRALVFTG